MIKKFFSLLLALTALLGLLTACGAAAVDHGGNGSQAGEAGGQDRDSVIIAISSEPETLDPCQGWGHGNTPIVQSTLVKYDYDMSFSNDLATGYNLSEDGLTWTFTLRDDAFFTDGEAVTASDVVFTFETAKAAQSSVDLTFLEAVEAPDDTTVVFTLSRPTSTFLNTIASVGIVPEHAYGPDYGTNPIGSGPFKFVQWNPQEQQIGRASCRERV